MVKALEDVQVLTVLPLNQDYTLNEENIRKQVEWCVQNGAKGIWVTGYLGEGNVIEDDVRKRAFKVFLEAAKGRLFCAAGCSGVNPFHSIKLVNYAEELGYDMAWIPPMAPRRPSDEELFDFFKLIHDKTTLPLAIYSTWAFNVYIRPEVTARIADKLKRIIAMKEVVSDFDHIAKLYKYGVYQKMKVFPTHGEVPQLMMGAAGCTCGPNRLVQHVEMIKAFKAGDIYKALKINLEASGDLPMAPALAAIAFGANIGRSTEGLSKARNGAVMGIEMGPPMAPYKPASPEEVKQFAEEVKTGKTLVGLVK